MHDVLDAISARIKAPYFGYALLAFIGLNWRGIFLLTLTNGSPHERLAAFDSQTSAWSLVVLPLIVGGLVTALSPWMRLIFGHLSKLPFEKIDNIHLHSEHKKTITKTQLEQSRSAFFASKESELIERAKRDEEVLEIEDENLKGKLKKEIEALRRERDSMSVDLSERKNDVRMLPQEREILKAAAADNSGNIMRLSHLDGAFIQIGSLIFGSESSRDFAKYDSALKDLVSKGLVSAVGLKGVMYELTHRGWELAETL